MFHRENERAREEESLRGKKRDGETVREKRESQESGIGYTKMGHGI